MVDIELSFHDNLLMKIILCVHVTGDKEHCAPMGRVAHECCVHRHWPDNGMGKQGNRDQKCWDRTSRWGLHAQEGTETEIFMWAKRQGMQKNSETSFLDNHKSIWLVKDHTIQKKIICSSHRSLPLTSSMTHRQTASLKSSFLETLLLKSDKRN